MEYYSTIKKNEITKISGKWMDPGSVALIMMTHTQKKKNRCVFTHMRVLAYKVSMYIVNRCKRHGYVYIVVSVRAAESLKKGWRW